MFANSVALLGMLAVSASGSRFACEDVAPGKLEPSNATEVHPGHISIVMAIGDSITAGFGAKGWWAQEEEATNATAQRVAEASPERLGGALGDYPMEFRYLSFSIGEGSSSYWTLPYFLRQYNPSLEGFSSRSTLPQTPSSGYWTGADSLNAALSNAHAWQLEQELDYLRENTQEIQDFDSRWKLLTFFISANDICDGWGGESGMFAACDGDRSHVTLLADRYETNMRKTLEHLRDNYRNIIVQMVNSFSMASVRRVRQGHSWCAARKHLLVLCNCLDSEVHGGGGDVSDEQLRLLDETVMEFNARLHKLVDEFNLQRPDFAVIAANGGEGQSIPDISYLSDLDCFHPSAKAHRAMAGILWNGLFDSNRTPTPLNSRQPLFCPDADSVIFVPPRVEAPLLV